MSKVIIIGGGVSGLTAAITLRKKGNDVVILERNDKVLKKLLLTGNGKCNYFNEDFNSNHYHSSSLNDLDVIINENEKNKLLDFYSDLGIVPYIKNGYYYPYSNQATNIKNLLLNKAKELNIEIINEVLVTDIEKNDKFIIKTDKGEFTSDKLVIAAGSYSYPKTGSDGSLFKVVEKLGHSIIKVLPALTGLIGKENYFKDWHGVRTNVNVKLYEDNNFIKEENGEIQLTDYGVSGICIMQLSGIVACGLNEGKSEKVVINFIPDYDKEWLYNYFNKFNNKSISEVLENLLNYKLSNIIIKKLGYSYDDKINSIDINKLIDEITSFELEIVGTNSFENAQTCSGGVSLEEVNLNNFESKKVSGLYLVGEVLDIYGDCGGYNLSFAFLSGLKVGDNND